MFAGLGNIRFDLSWVIFVFCVKGGGGGASVFFPVFSVVFCVWEQVSVSLTRRGVGGVFDKLEVHLLPAEVGQLLGVG